MRRDDQLAAHRCDTAVSAPRKTGRPRRDEPAARLQLRIPAELAAQFARRCEELGIAQAWKIKGLILDWLDQ